MQFRYTTKFLKALEFTLKWEGGYSNHPMDSGGPTMKGITQLVYDEYCKEKNIPNKPVKDISDDEVNEIYYNDYYLMSNCNKLSNKLAVCVFDMAVNSGIKRARRLLTKTLDPDEYIRLRIDYLRSIAKGKNKVFLQGWLNRVNDLKEYIRNI